MYESYQEHPRESKSHIGLVIITLLLAVLVIAGAIFAIRMFKAPAEPEVITEAAGPGIVYDAAAQEGGWENLSPEEIEASLNEKVAQGMINISMNTSPVYADGTSAGNIMVVNETINLYPQRVEFIRNDTQEVIYTSNAIPVGSKIEAAPLDVDLDQGQYECTALFHNLDPVTGAVLGTAGAIIYVTVQN